LASAKRPRGRAATAREPLTPEQVVELATRHNLAELEIEQGGVRIRVVREHAPAAAPPPFRAEPTSALPAETSTESHLVPIEAPMVGTFYRAPAPDAAPFVAEGDLVRGERDLIVRVEIHEVIAVVLVEELHALFFEIDELDLLTGSKRVVDDPAEPHVLELGPHEGAALARLDVLEVDDRVRRPVEVDLEPLLELRRGDLHRIMAPSVAVS
jgi:acetyl-CoA carboxylase biotin carboxyl carrier protein